MTKSGDSYSSTFGLCLSFIHLQTKNIIIMTFAEILNDKVLKYENHKLILDVPYKLNKHIDKSIFSFEGGYWVGVCSPCSLTYKLEDYVISAEKI